MKLKKTTETKPFETHQIYFIADLQLDRIKIGRDDSPPEYCLELQGEMSTPIELIQVLQCTADEYFEIINRYSKYKIRNGWYYCKGRLREYLLLTTEYEGARTFSFYKHTAKGKYVLTFGKHQDEQLDDVADFDPDYLIWLAGKSDFPETFKVLIRDRYPHLFVLEYQED